MLTDFAITHFAPPTIVVIDGYDLEELAYVGQDDHTDSLFHAMGYQLTDYGLYEGDVETLRSLTATTITQLYESGAVNLINTFIEEKTTHAGLAEYVNAVKDGSQPGDLLCIIAMEYHFGVRIVLYHEGELLPVLHPHFCPVDCDTVYLDLAGAFSYAPLVHYELPPLESENYCLTCGISVPNPLESICSDCVKRPRFCVSCGLAYVATETLCIHCVERMNYTLARSSEALADTDFEAIIQTCQRAGRSSPTSPPPLIDEEPPQFCVYLANAPFDDFRSGDGTYMNEIVKWIDQQSTLTLHGQTYKVKAFRVCDTGKAKKRPHEESAVSLIEIPYIEDWPTSQEETENMTMQGWQRYYQPAREMVFDHLAKRRAEDTNPHSIHIFHAQVRYPDSGALYNREFLENLRRAKFKIVVTCHEMEFNFLTPKNMQKTVVQLNEFVAAADRVIFLNEYDLMNGVRLIESPSLLSYVSHHAYEEELALEALKASMSEETDTINPTGVYETEIRVPSPVTECLFHIPGIATVAGAPFGIEEVLRRRENILVFGLIKQKEAMDAASDVARMLRMFPDLQVIVVGKVFKDYQHTAIARLIRRKCHLTSKEEGVLCRKFDDIGKETRSDEEFYRQLMLAIQAEERACTQKWETCRQGLAVDFKKSVDRVSRAVVGTMERVEHSGEDFGLDRMEDLQRQIAALKVAAELAPTLLADAQNDLVLEQRMQNAEEGYQTLLAKLQRLIRTLEGIKEAEDAKGRVERTENTVNNVISKDLPRLRKAMGTRKWTSAMLPIQIVFDASPEELQELASRCRYAFKVDQKSMADNASSIISLMAQGCIVFTESRFDTPDEYRRGGPSGGLLSPVIMPPNHLGTCDGQFVVDEIARRRRDRQLNIQTLKNMLTLLTKRYGLNSVAAKHLTVYKTLFEK